MTSKEKEIESFKVVLIGESGVGKTSIITQFIEQTFSEDTQSTNAGTFSSKSVICDENRDIKFEIWDTAGQERFRALTRMYYKDTNAAILVYDITVQHSFDELKSYWYEQIKENSSSDVILVIAANKTDLIDQEEVDEEEARSFAESINALFMRISAKNILGIENMFIEIAKKYTGCDNIRIKEEEDNEVIIREKSNSQKITREKTLKKNKNSCC